MLYFRIMRLAAQQRWRQGIPMFCDKMWEHISRTVPVGGSKFRLCTGYKGEQDSEVGLVTRLRDGYPRNRASIIGRGNKFVPTPKRRPDRL
jgi:hypothetical protein